MLFLNENPKWCRVSCYHDGPYSIPFLTLLPSEEGLHRNSSQLCLDVLRLLLRLLGASAELACNPLVSALNAFPDLGESSIGRVGRSVLKVGRLLAGLGLQLLQGGSLGNRLNTC
jgi:hypothetical protein